MRKHKEITERKQTGINCTTEYRRSSNIMKVRPQCSAI